jgi:hypothetical protein
MRQEKPMNLTASRLRAAWRWECISGFIVAKRACAPIAAGTSALLMLAAISCQAQVVVSPAVNSASAPVSTASPSSPPIQFRPAVRESALPPAPKGFVWQRLEAIEVAVVTPESWKMHQKDDAVTKTFAFSGDPLNDKGQFETGLTVRLMWHPQTLPGNEAKAAESVMAGIAKAIYNNKSDNQVIRSTLDDKAGKRVMIIRYRNAPAGLPPIVVHAMAIGDSRTGLVYQIIFESPERQWDDSWKIGEQILSRVSVFFQKG